MHELTLFRKEVELFLAREGMTATAFGREFVSDPTFVFELREGREPRISTRTKIQAAMRAYARRVAA